MGLWQIINGEQPGPIESFLHYENKGQFGEYATQYALNSCIFNGYYHTIHNVYIPYKNGTTELDILMIHEKGIFVFESKNYSGWIFGDADQLNWTQCLSNHKKNKFYNPIKQNITHCNALVEYLKIPAEIVHSYIVFSERCELKSVPPDTDQYKIVRRPNMLKTLRRDIASQNLAFTKKQVDEYAIFLKNATNVTAEQKQKHIDDIKEKIEGNTCPFCGGELQLKKGKYGDFYGCKSYPKCKYTRKVQK